ncbi:MAG: helix-turn-helix domain-containing protein [Luteibacter sp.]|uniref:helix-turn-helix domain-containing protein n=1 Tax=Luteibacter sp. TaxID=1886636 RepID=UPI00280888E1|nr:helix-turn-helix domain-containing protein [Luteibacter sp.]MDQ7996093.1 helix-turn-helix domain-containing protein [Luteibacter sp.]
MTKTAIQKAIEAAEGQAALARAIKVQSQVVWQWADDRRPVPAHHCLAIEAACKGAVTRYELRPDVFGAGPDSVPATKPKRKAA